jgi:hypothetical protein
MPALQRDCGENCRADISFAAHSARGSSTSAFPQQHFALHDNAKRARNFTSMRVKRSGDTRAPSFNGRRSIPLLTSLRDDLIIGRRTLGRSKGRSRWRTGIIPRREIAEKESARSRWTTYTGVYVQCYRNHSGLPSKIRRFRSRRRASADYYANEIAGELRS